MYQQKFYFRGLTVEQPLVIVESEQFWRDIEDNDGNGDIYITPPNDDAKSDENSGDEDTEIAVDHLSGRQLSAEATATIRGKTND